MARISTKGLEELMNDLEAVAELPNGVVYEMLNEQAEVVIFSESLFQIYLGKGRGGTNDRGNVSFIQHTKYSKEVELKFREVSNNNNSTTCPPNGKSKLYMNLIVN